MTVAATSIEAKRSLKSSVTKKARGLIFRHLIKAGPIGATLNELEDILGIRLQSLCARRNELGKMGVVVDGGTRRPTPSGRSATVWVVPERVMKKAKERGICE